MERIIEEYLNSPQYKSDLAYCAFIANHQIKRKQIMETIVIIYTVRNALRMKVLEMKQDWVAQCYELDELYENWRIV